MLVDLDGLQPGAAGGLKRQARDLARLAAGLPVAPLGHAVDLPAVSPCLPGRISPAANRLEAAMAGHRGETARYFRGKQKRGEQVL